MLFILCKTVDEDVPLEGITDEKYRSASKGRVSSTDQFLMTWLAEILMTELQRTRSFVHYGAMLF
jgi:hypothetical protein